MKVCFKCGAEKPLADFYKHKKMADGHLNKCKECTKTDVSSNRKDNLEYYLHYDRNRPNAEARNAAISRQRKARYHADDDFRARVLGERQRWAERNPQKRRAQHAVSNAVRDEKLSRPDICEHCGTAERRIQAHHWSYSPEHWLDVIWLCTKCHGAEHRRLNGLGRDPDRSK